MAGGSAVADLVSMAKRSELVLLASLVLSVLAPMRCVPRIPLAHASSVIAGYVYSQNLLVTNPATTTIGGSVVTGTVLATSTDYVVQVHLAGPEAAAIYASAWDKSKFTDVTVWWFNGSSYVQLDTDYDPYTNGSWSANNVTLWFKLQAPIAGGSSDGNYVLAWGNVSPVVKRDWTHIYPFSDDFNTSVGQGPDGSGRTGWNTTEWGTKPGSIALSGGNFVLTAPVSATTSFVSASPYRSYGGGYALSARVKFPLMAGSQASNFGFIQTSGPADYSWVAASMWGVRSAICVPGCTYGSYLAIDQAFDEFTDGMSADETSYFWESSGTPMHNSTPVTMPQGIDVNVWNMGATTLLVTVDYVKVRPFQPAEPIVTVSSPLLTGLPADANLFSLTVTGAALSLTSPTTITAPAATLNEYAQSTSALLSPLGVTDARGTGAGWSLTLAMADPTSGSHHIPFPA